MDELKRYQDFQKAVFEGVQEAARLDAEPERPFVPYGRCPRHPSVETFLKGFDVPCYKCEAEMEDYR